MEILSPAGNYRSAIAAFAGGADAVYLGGKSFSARMNADNFSNDELTSIIDYAHSIGKKVYVTLNTLLYQDEFMAAADFAGFLYQISVDGIIVQDLGLAFYLHQVVPGLALHASTQLNCHNLEQAKALKEAGFVRVVLARECPKAFIAEVKALGLEVEVFIHGALCVSYSGNCLLSSFIGGRSGNRGRCAQPCRMNYNLYEDGKEIAKDTYAISTKDLETLDAIEELKRAGADSLKIEGRLKSEAYVYQTALAYRRAVDGVKDPFDREKLQALYSRGFTKGFINEESPFLLLNQKTSSHQGERIGKVVRFRNGRVSIRLEKEVHRLDGVRFNGPDQFGMALEKFFVHGEPKETGLPGEIIDIPNIDVAKNLVGLEVIRTTDHQLEESIKAKVDVGVRTQVKGSLTMKIGKPLVLRVSYEGTEVTVVGGMAEKPLKAGTPWERISAQLGKSGEYPYRIVDLVIEGDDAFVTISSLNALRNEAFAKLHRILTQHRDLSKGTYACDAVVPATPFAFLATFLHGENATPYWAPFVQNRVIYGAIQHKDNELLSFAAPIPKNIRATASPYCNITNSYALDFYFKMGFASCFASLEMDVESLRLMVEDYVSRHGVNPNIGLFVYGRPDLMILKSCPVGTLFRNQKLHCNRCHAHRYELEDRLGERYPLEGDSICTTTLYANRPIYLLDRLEEIKNIPVSYALLHFTYESEEEKRQILADIEGDGAFDRERYSRGHYQKRSL